MLSAYHSLTIISAARQRPMRQDHMRTWRCRRRQTSQTSRVGNARNKRGPKMAASVQMRYLRHPQFSSSICHRNLAAACMLAYIWLKWIQPNGTFPTVREAAPYTNIRHAIRRARRAGRAGRNRNQRIKIASGSHSPGGFLLVQYIHRSRLAVSTASYETRQDAKTSKAVPFYETLPGNHSSTDPPLTSPHTASSPRTRTASATIIPLGTHTFSDGQGRGSFPSATAASLPLLIPNRDAISISLRIDCKT